MISDNERVFNNWIANTIQMQDFRVGDHFKIGKNMKFRKFLVEDFDNIGEKVRMPTLVYYKTIDVFVDNNKGEILMKTKYYNHIEKIIIGINKVIFFCDGQKFEAEAQGIDAFDLEKGIYLCIAKMSTKGYSLEMTNTQFHKFVNGLKKLDEEVLWE